MKVWDRPVRLLHWTLAASIALGRCVTGWLCTADALQGDATVDLLHRGFAWGLLGLIVLHVGGVIFTSLRQRENLVRSMLNGKHRDPRDDDAVRALRPRAVRQ